MLHWYPALNLRAGWGRFTNDGTIPWKLFWLYYRQLPRVVAGERLNLIEAFSMNIRMAFTNGKKDPKAAAEIKAELRRLQQFAEDDS